MWEVVREEGGREKEREGGVRDRWRSERDMEE